MEETKIDVTTKFTLTSLTKWLNENFVKGKKSDKTNESFSVADVQGYIRRGCLPSYLKPGYQIKIGVAFDIPGAKLYKLKEIKLHKK